MNGTHMRYTGNFIEVTSFGLGVKRKNPLPPTKRVVELTAKLTSKKKIRLCDLF
jgi:hypothetical protein